MIVTIATPDKFYYNQLLVMLTSLYKHNPEVSTTVVLVDFPSDKESFLSDKFPLCKFINKKVNQVDNRGISLIRERIVNMHNTLSCCCESATWIDIDVVIRGNISGLTEVGPRQLKILYRKNNPEKVLFNAGIFSIGCSLESMDFLYRWKTRLERNMKWGMGQLELWRTYQEFKEMIELVELDSKYNDLGGSDRPNAFADDSIIWHCKKAHFDNPKFQKEFQYYLKKV